MMVNVRGPSGERTTRGKEAAMGGEGMPVSVRAMPAPMLNEWSPHSGG